jgi:hypothetical protein
MWRGCGARTCRSRFFPQPQRKTKRRTAAEIEAYTRLLLKRRSRPTVCFKTSEQKKYWVLRMKAPETQYTNQVGCGIDCDRRACAQEEREISVCWQSGASIRIPAANGRRPVERKAVRGNLDALSVRGAANCVDCRCDHVTVTQGLLHGRMSSPSSGNRGARELHCGPLYRMRCSRLSR